MELEKSNSINLWNSTSLWNFQTSTFGCKLENVSITYQNCAWQPQGPLKKFKKTHRREVRSTAACNLRCHATTVHFLAVIDRESVLPPIFRGLCDVWSTLKSVTFVTDECNASSLGPPERLKKLVAVRIRYVSFRRMYSHMYPWSCAPSHVSSDMYVKDEVLCRARQWEPWSTSVK